MAIGRWKAGAGGAPIWEEGVSGPNQVEPPPGAPQTQGVAGILPGAPSPSSQRPQTAPQSQRPPQQGGSGVPQAGSQPFQREQFRDAWMATGSDKAAQDQLLAQHGLTPDAAGRVTLPTGEVMDLRYGARAGGTQATWTGAGGAKAGQSPGGWEAGGSPAVGAPGASGGVPGAGGAPPPAGVSKELYDTLLARAKQGTTIDRMDPNIRQQVDPFTAQQERARRDYLADVAEREGPRTNLRGEERLAAERAGQASGLFESQLIGRELDARRQEIESALQQLGNRLTVDQQQALQRELAQLDDATRRLGIRSQADIAQGQLGLGREQLGLARDQFGLDIGRTEQDLFLRSQGL